MPQGLRLGADQQAPHPLELPAVSAVLADVDRRDVARAKHRRIAVSESHGREDVERESDLLGMANGDSRPADEFDLERLKGAAIGDLLDLNEVHAGYSGPSHSLDQGELYTSFTQQAVASGLLIPRATSGPAPGGHTTIFSRAGCAAP